MSNYKEHPFKTSHLRPDENSLDGIAGTSNPDQRSDHVSQIALATKCDIDIEINFDDMSRLTRYDIIFIGMVNFIVVVTKVGNNIDVRHVISFGSLVMSNFSGSL
ncbi:hypothetical protein M9H77_14410 [Catharanthus roseus]|uniref:Uncharacterized protein n=1 Tax=Catharanthus roseus TaxID=4058 RepID=A0ACC0BN26_CATRO|nr:hypothetical protein M9H77_14410 [Catharanthus roseus]